MLRLGGAGTCRYNKIAIPVRRYKHPSQKSTLSSSITSRQLSQQALSSVAHPPADAAVMHRTCHAPYVPCTIRVMHHTCNLAHKTNSRASRPPFSSKSRLQCSMDHTRQHTSSPPPRVEPPHPPAVETLENNNPAALSGRRTNPLPALTPPSSFHHTSACSP